MAKGNHTNAYASVTPNRFSIADTIVQQDQLNNQRNEQKRRDKILEEQRQEKIFQRDEKLRERLMKIPQNYDTKSASLNEFQGRIIMQAVNRKGEIYNALRSGKLSDSERVKLEIENQTLDNLPSNLKVATGNFTKLIDDYTKGVAEGKFFKNEDFEKKVLNGFDNYIGGLDENGFPLLGFVDADGDGKMDLMPWDNLQKGIGAWDFQPKVDLDKQIDALKIGTEEIQKVSGFKTTTTKVVPDNVAESAAKGLMYGADGDLTNTAKSRLRELGYDYKNPTEDQLKSVEGYIINRIKSSKDSSNKEEFNHSAAISQQRLAFDKSKDARDYKESKKKNDSPSIGEAVTPSVNTWGSHYKEIAPGAKSVPLSGKITLNAIQGSDKKNYSNVTVENYTYDKNGKLLISGSYSTGKTTRSLYPGNFMSDDKTAITENKKMKIRVTPETESRIAKQLGLSVEELKANAGYKKNSKIEELPDFKNELPDL